MWIHLLLCFHEYVTMLKQLTSDGLAIAAWSFFLLIWNVYDTNFSNHLAMFWLWYIGKIREGLNLSDLGLDFVTTQAHR